MTLLKCESFTCAAATSMRPLILTSLSLVVAACSIPTTVQRMGVGYNNAAANLSDELALLNIVRASRGYPLHYTSLTRLSGSITFKGTAGIGSQFNARGHEADTDTTTGSSSTVEVVKKVTSAARQLAPSLGAEVDSNPSFDIDVNDTKEFYQGILSGIEPSTIADLLMQGYERDELLGLTVNKVKFVQKGKLEGFESAPDSTLLTIVNNGAPVDPHDSLRVADLHQLRVLFDCYDFNLDTEPTTLAPLSRVTGQSDKEKGTLSIKDLALLDGTKLDLSGPVNASPSKDAETRIVRPSDKLVAHFVWVNGPYCADMKSRPIKIGGKTEYIYVPSTPPADRTFVGNSKMMVLVRNGNVFSDGYVEVDPSVAFRSPESVIQFVGDCLRASGNYGIQTCSFDGILLFELRRGQPEPGDVSVDFGREHFFISTSGRNGPVSLRTLGLIEKLIDLHRSSTDKPTTVPVHIVS